ncbi:MAG TPA: hypothetical protein VJL58_08515 [Pyrinomonadaceae bacterium]|nr:hypothetical protein [Pyrinomonadaceae bacterium]
MKSLCFGPAFAILVTLTVSCGLFDIKPGSRPTQVVNFPSMIDKPAHEITTIVGKPPYRDDKDLGVDWELPEGNLSLSHTSGSLPTPYRTRFITYDLKPDFGFATPEEMAELVHIDVKGEKPEKDRRGILNYRDLTVNGKKVNLSIEPRDRGRYTNATLSYDE